jgi:hypothetical protein
MRKLCGCNRKIKRRSQETEQYTQDKRCVEAISSYEMCIEPTYFFTVMLISFQSFFIPRREVTAPVIVPASIFVANSFRSISSSSTRSFTFTLITSRRKVPRHVKTLCGMNKRVVLTNVNKPSLNGMSGLEHRREDENVKGD